MARPRDPRADEAILAATLDLLADVGFGRLTIDAVAATAGVGKATIYRRWDSKEQMVLDALRGTRRPVDEVDTGDLRDDLRHIYAATIGAKGQEVTVRLMPALAVEAANDPDVAERLRAFVDDRRVPTRAAFARAIDRGQVAPDTDTELCIDMLTGAVMNRLFFSGNEVSEAMIDRAIDLVLRAVTPE